MKKIYTYVFTLVIAMCGYSQETPVLKVGDKPLGLSSLDIKVEVIGNIATTTYDMLFYNPTSTILEGELSFPLGEGHNVSRFALDVNGKLREAVVVEKELGRIAFEAVVRRGVDPALLEKGTGNNYKARIYPIPANGYKRVLLAYEQELVFNDGAHYFNLPLSFKNKIDDFKLEITVFDQKSKPVVEKGQISGLEFSNWEKNYSTSIEKKKYIPNKSLLIKIPIPINTEKVLTNNNYFYIYKTISPQKRLRQKPKRVTIYWDVSLSMKERELEKELAFLNNYFEFLKNVEVRFVTFSNLFLSDKKIKVVNGDWSVLKKEIEAVIYDGGTSYKPFLNDKEYPGVKLLFSDGVSNLSDLTIESKQPVFIINSIVKSNHAALKHFAEKTNGAYINLKTASVSDAVSAIKFEAFKFIGFESKTKDIEVYPKEPISVSHDFSIAGKNFKHGETIILNFGYGKEITQKESVKINTSQSSNASINRYWAQKKLDYLEVNSEENEISITNLGKEYSLVTDYTSLIVLDDVRDYIMYKITPPEELLEEYNQLLARNDTIRDFGFEDEMPPPPSALEAIEVVDDEEKIGEIIEESDLEEVVVEGYMADRSPNNRRNEVLHDRRVNNSPNNQTEPNGVVDYPKYSGSLKLKDRKVVANYLTKIRKTQNKEEAYKIYLEERENYVTTPAYFIDVSNHFKQQYNDTIYSARILSNIAETDFDNYELLKVFAYQLQVNKENDLALFIFKQILKLRPEDSQSYRDLAIAYQNVDKCQEALNLFNSIITGEIYKNNKRRVFKGISDIAKNEVKRLIHNYKEDLDLKEVDKTLLEPVGFDIRVVVDWNHNDTDIDLHIIDPNLEECFYSHNETKIGGKMSPDMTQGFGPEEFVLKDAIKGTYYVKIKYYGDRYQKIGNPTFMKVTMFKNYGKKNESKEIKIIRLTKSDNEEIIAKITF